MKLKVFIALIMTINLSCTLKNEPKLDNYATGFNEITSDSFSFLNNILNDVRVVGYGEDTHGTAEFTFLAQELLKYLNIKKGFKIFIIETGFGEGQYLNDYIHGNNDDLKGILNSHNSSWRYRTEEFQKLLNWLKAYNLKNTDKIHIYGCEMQYVLSDLNRIKTYLNLVSSKYDLCGFEKHLWQNISDNEKINYFLTYTDLKKHFEDNYETFVNKTSEKNYQLAYHHVKVLGQFVTTISQNMEQRKHDFRDIYMSENIQWILNFHGDQAKALYWAHNAHVGDWVSNGIVDVTGHQLRKIYKNKYFNIATDFGLGEFKAFSNDWKMKTFKQPNIIEGTLTQNLQKLGSPNTFINLRLARNDKCLTEYLSSNLTSMSGAGAQIRSDQIETNNIGKAFDAIIYINETHKINFIE